ncbi:MAG: putative metallophosphoesterase YhaO [Pelotomaculum sp. PtaB.Bin104]|nr:MAG: putative metallophosphoesterase YhaO [Pelotomaculum sp. PtaB.Bin104]
MSGSFTFVHTADLHLDSQFRGFELAGANRDRVPGKVLRRLRNCTFEAYERIVDLCIEQRADFLLLAGDIYDVADKSLRAQLKFRDGLVRLAEAGIQAFVVHGNHDHCAGWRADLEFPKTVHIFSDQAVEHRPVFRGGREIATVYGISYPGPAVAEDLAGRFERRPGASYAIALLHCNVGRMAGYENYAPCRLSDLLRKGFDYWALGHVHSQVWLNPSGPGVAYPGCPQGRHHREAGDKGCLLVKVTGENAAIQFVPTATVRWETVRISIEGVNSDQVLLEKLEERLLGLWQSLDEKSLVVRVQLIGRGALYKHLARAAYLDNLLGELRGRFSLTGESFIWIDSISNGTKGAVDKAELAATDTLLGDLLSMAQRARADQKLKQELLGALASLIEHPRAGRYLELPHGADFDDLLDRAEELAIDLLWDGE